MACRNGASQKCGEPEWRAKKGKQREKKIPWEDKNEGLRITPSKRKWCEQILEILVNVEVHGRFSQGLVSQLFVKNGPAGVGLLLFL